MMSVGRVQEKIERVCRANRDAETLRHDVIRILRQAVPFDAWCWPLFDPETLLPFDGMGETPFQTQEQLQIFTLNYQTAASPTVLARSPGRAYPFSLSASTGGDLARSRLWEEVYRPTGLGDELRVALTSDGLCWGSLMLYRARAASWFTSEEAALLRWLIQPVVTKLRQTLISSPLVPLTPSPGPGVVVLGADLQPLAMTPLAQHWVTQVWPDWRQDFRLLPTTLSALIARLEAIEREVIPASWAPRVRLRSSTGNWLILQVERLAHPSSPGLLALTLQPAMSAQLLPLLLQAFALTRREQELTRFVFQGLSTAEIAAALHISPYTVQQHLKTIFAKVGVRSRRELVARLSLS